MADSDGVEELLDESARAAVMVASQAAEPLLRMVADERRQARARAWQRAQELEQRMAAERAAARAELAAVGRDEWWDKATERDVVRAWQVATAWAPLDQDADTAVRIIRGRAQTRYGVDLADAAQVDPAIVQAQREKLHEPYRVEPTSGRTFEDPAATAALARAAARANELTAVAILIDHDPRNNVHGVARYDSADRRSELADRLERSSVDAEIVEARLVADKGFAAAPAAAVAPPARTKSSARLLQAAPRGPQVDLGR